METDDMCFVHSHHIPNMCYSAQHVRTWHKYFLNEIYCLETWVSYSESEYDLKHQRIKLGLSVMLHELIMNELTSPILSKYAIWEFLGNVIWSTVIQVFSKGLCHNE